MANNKMTKKELIVVIIVLVLSATFVLTYMGNSVYPDPETYDMSPYTDKLVPEDATQLEKLHVNIDEFAIVFRYQGDLPKTKRPFKNTDQGVLMLSPMDSRAFFPNQDLICILKEDTGWIYVGVSYDRNQKRLFKQFYDAIEKQKTPNSSK